MADSLYLDDSNTGKPFLKTIHSNADEMELWQSSAIWRGSTRSAYSYTYWDKRLWVLLL